jgi:integrase
MFYQSGAPSHHQSHFNLAIAEHGLDMRNPFASIFMPEVIVRSVSPYLLTQSVRYSNPVIVHDDDMRWLIALISDTGMRLAEAAGLHIDDLHLDEEVPYVDIKPHPWRSLKDQRQSETSAFGWCIAMGSTAYQRKCVLMLCLP